jgi:hypothetical protein
MIRKEGVCIIITCDGCGQVQKDQEGQRAKWRSHQAVWKEAQDAGWSAKKKLQVSDYDHFCPDCSAGSVAR